MFRDLIDFRYHFQRLLDATAKTISAVSNSELTFEKQLYLSIFVKRNVLDYMNKITEAFSLHEIKMFGHKTNIQFSKMNIYFRFRFNPKNNRLQIYFMKKKLSETLAKKESIN